jgi:acyl carrier protein
MALMAGKERDLSTLVADSEREITKKIKHLLVSELNVDSAIASTMDSSSPLLGRGIGLDSGEAIALVVAIEEEFNISVPDSDLTADLFDTIETLARYISKKALETNGKGSVSENAH